jgi:hypothetical protein
MIRVVIRDSTAKIGGRHFGRKKAQKAQKRQNNRTVLFFAPFVPFCGHSSSGIFIPRGARRASESDFVIPP